MHVFFQESHFTFPFTDDRIIPRFHLEGVESGRLIIVFMIGPATGERRKQLATATVGEGGWVDLPEPIIVRAGETFIAVPQAHPYDEQARQEAVATLKGRTDALKSLRP